MDYPDNEDLKAVNVSQGGGISLAQVADRAASVAAVKPLYDELLALLSGAGVTPSESKQNQVLEAINKLRKDALYDKTTDYLATQGRKNILINGKPQVWQNGDSFTATGYSADQWYTVLSSATCTRDTDPKKGLLVTVNSSGGYGQFFQPIESLEVKQLQGRTLTFSVQYAVNASFSGELRLEVFYSNSSDLLASVSASLVAKHFTPTADTSGIESLTFEVPNDAVGLRVALLPVDGQAVGSQMALYNAQLERGTMVTPFEYNHYVDEYQRCCRYFYKHNKRTHLHHYQGNIFNSDLLFPVPMRTSPAVSLIGIHGSAHIFFDSNTYNWGTTGVYVHNNNDNSVSSQYFDNFIADARL